jgi:serine/threonine protein kinase
MLQECRSVEEFERLNRISEGTYGVVYRAREKSTGRIVALKKVRLQSAISATSDWRYLQWVCHSGLHPL